MQALALEEVRPQWSVCHRLIASRFPTVTLFDQVADPKDLDIVYAIESLTNPRLRQELGELSLVPVEERVSGPGSTLIMATFTHLNPAGSRFSDGSYGVYYAAESLTTAVAETSHHSGKFLARTNEREIDVDMRWIQAEVNAMLHELRGAHAVMPEIYNPDYYAHSQALARPMRDRGSAGLIYTSVRRELGECIAVFRPTGLSRAIAKGYIALHWNGSKISHWYGKDEPSAV